MSHKKLFFTGILILCLVFSVLVFAALQTPEIKSKNPSFSAHMDEKIKTNFLEVWREYEILHAYEFQVKQESLGSSTMQAQPIIGFTDIFQKRKAYQLSVAEKVLDSGELMVAELPAEVLRGWFAHELGHVVDYENHSNLGMIAYGIRYLLSDSFKRDREHEADSVAIRHGFKAEIIATKKYLMENDFISPAYQSQLRKYYMSVAAAELCPDDILPVLPKVDL